MSTSRKSVKGTMKKEWAQRRAIAELGMAQRKKEIYERNIREMASEIGREVLRQALVTVEQDIERLTRVVEETGR